MTGVFVYPWRPEALDPLEPSLQVVVSHPEGAGNQTWVGGHLEGPGPALLYQHTSGEAWRLRSTHSVSGPHSPKGFDRKS